MEHVKYIIDKVEKSQETNEKKESFKPYKTTKSNVHDPTKEKERKLPKNWEVTAATPPLIIHGATKILSINESLKWQKEQTKKLQVFDFFSKCLKNFQELFIYFYIIVNIYTYFNISQEIQAKHAIERLANRIGMHSIGSTSQNIGTYHIQHTNNLLSSSSSEDEDEEEHEVQDEEDNDKSGTVVFTVDSIES